MINYIDFDGKISIIY